MRVICIILSALVWCWVGVGFNMTEAQDRLCMGINWGFSEWNGSCVMPLDC